MADATGADAAPSTGSALLHKYAPWLLSLIPWLVLAVIAGKTGGTVPPPPPLPQALPAACPCTCPR